MTDDTCHDPRQQIYKMSKYAQAPEIPYSCLQKQIHVL